MEEEEIFKVYKDTRKNSNNGALWEVSNWGSVRKNGKKYIPSENQYGYLYFGKMYFVHRAVAELFLEKNIYQKPTVDHINRQKTDNHFWNLRWATYKEQSNNRDLETTRMKISAAHKGKKLSEEHRAKLRAAHLGRKNSEESKAKNRAASLGNKHTLGKVWVFIPTTEHSNMIDPSELNDYIAKGYIRGREGKRHSEETKAKMSAAQLGRRLSEETKSKIGISKIDNKNVRGKVWVFNPTTEQSARVYPSQLTEFLDKGYIRGRKTKK